MKDLSLKPGVASFTERLGWVVKPNIVQVRDDGGEIMVGAQSIETAWAIAGLAGTDHAKRACSNVDKSIVLTKVEHCSWVEVQRDSVAAVERASRILDAHHPVDDEARRCEAFRVREWESET